MTRLFGDSYAFIAAMDGSTAYAKLFRENEIVTSALNVLEIAQAIQLRMGREHILEAIRPILRQVVEPGVLGNVVRNAAEFRSERRDAGGKCSTVDAWGYAIARSHKVPFLTGDEDFRGVPGVKFVKA